MTDNHHNGSNTRNHGKPVIRVIHNLARSGGTLIAKCLGSMQNTALLSEIHPDAQIALSFNALHQAQNWYGVDKSLNWQKTPFIDAIKIIHKHCLNQQQEIVLRDWSHVDFFGIPVTNTPKLQASLVNSLQPHFHVLSVQSVRNPVDTWLSMRRLQLIRKAKITPEQFMQSYLEYLEKTSGNYQLLYENFLETPNEELKQACKHLQLNFDKNYQTKWFEYTNVTGDLSNSSSLRKNSVIKPRPRKNVDQSVLNALKASPAYEKVMQKIPAYDTF